MAGKKSKKPKHTNLVVPGDDKKEEKKRPKPPQLHGGVAGKPTPPQEQPAGPAETRPGPAEAGPPEPARAFAPPLGVIPPKPKGSRRKKGRLQIPAQAVAGAEGPAGMAMPQRPRRRMSAARRRRLWRRVRMGAVVALAAAVALFFTSGAYLVAAGRLSDAMDGLRIAVRPGGGFPLALSVTGYVRAEPMGQDGAVMLGAQEAVMLASSGLVLRNIPHAYLNPGVSAGDARAVVYSVGGKEYTVEGRGKTLAAHATEHDIQFCEMSPGGALAVVTSSRYRTYLQVYGITYDTAAPDFFWTMVDDKPVAAAFAADNRTLALGCVSARGGALGTTIHLLRTDRDTVQTSIRADGALLLQMQYADGNRLVAVYDTFAAVYNQRGEELARCDYAARRLLTADIRGGQTALVFGTTTREVVHTVLLNQQMETVFETAAYVNDTPQVLAAPQGVFLLCGRELLAYDAEGAQRARHTYGQKTMGLAWCGQPLAVVTARIEPVLPYLQAQSASAAQVVPSVSPGAEGSSSSSSSSGSGAPASHGGEAPGEGAPVQAAAQ